MTTSEPRWPADGQPPAPAPSAGEGAGAPNVAGTAPNWPASGGVEGGEVGTPKAEPQGSAVRGMVGPAYGRRPTNRGVWVVAGVVGAVLVTIVVAGLSLSPGGSAKFTAGSASPGLEPSSTSAVPPTTTQSHASTSPPTRSSSPTSSAPAPTGQTTLSPSVTAGTAVPWSPTSSNTLVGGGTPAQWPAARATAPSLAGAYGTNMIRVFVTLMAYQDWVWSHPNTTFVANYMVPGTRPYLQEVAGLTALEKKGWHSPPRPTEIDWVKVSQPPTVARIPGIATKTSAKQQEVATITCVLNRTGDVYLNAAGKVVGSWTGAGRLPYSVWFTRSVDGVWRIASIVRLKIPVSSLPH